jgi:MraZ protein
MIPEHKKLKLFMGEYFLHLDRKRRFYLPSTFRFTSRFLLTKNEFEDSDEKYLFLYSPELLRLTGIKAEECIIDKEGRIYIPKHLSDYAEIKNEIAVLGVGNGIEIWNKGRWETYHRLNWENYLNLMKSEQLLEK